MLCKNLNTKIITFFYVLFSAPMSHALWADDLETMLNLIPEWVDGAYDNSAQYERDENDGAIREEEKHRMFFQIFAPVNVDWLDGVTIWQQSSPDGSNDPDWVTRAGLLWYFPDADSGTVRQRELNLKEDQLIHFANAHQKPSILDALSWDHVEWSEGCDFHLRFYPEVPEIRGPITKNSCHFYSETLGKELYADDEIVIRPSQYWFRGRFIDNSGNVMWGNESEELNKLVRVQTP